MEKRDFSFQGGKDTALEEPTAAQPCPCPRLRWRTPFCRAGGRETERHWAAR